MSGRLEGKVAVITGTGGGQGREAALRFSAEGATIVGCDLHEAGAQETVELVRAQGGVMSSAHPLDLSDSAAVTSWVDAAAREHGGIDILYNNASAQYFRGIADMTDEEWRFTIRNDLELVFFTCRAAWPHLARRRTSAIVTTASIQGMVSLRDSPGGFAHAASKDGLIGMARELASEGGPLGIRINTISPGFIMSPVTAERFKDKQELVQALVEHQIIKRVGVPEDVVKTALFLASDDAAFITGQNIVVDGGFTVV